MGRRRRWLGRGLLGLALTGGAGVGGGALWLRTPAGQEALRGLVVEQVSGLMGEGRLELDGVQTDLVRRVELRGVRLLDGSGRPVVALERVDLTLRTRDLLRSRVVVESLVIAGPGVDVQADAQGVLDLSRMFPSEEDSGPSGGLPVEVVVQSLRLDLEQLSLQDGGLALALGEVQLQAQGRAVGQWVELQGLDLDAVWRLPEAGPLAVDGALTWDGQDLAVQGLGVRTAGSELALDGRLVDLIGEDPRVSVGLRAPVLDLDGIERLAGELGLRGVVAVDAHLDGPLSALAVSAELSGPAGAAQVEGQVDLLDERLAWEATVRAERLALHQLVDAVTEPTVLNGRVQAAGAGTRWPEDLEVQGTVALSEALAWGYRLPGLEGVVRVEQGRARVTGLRYRTDWGALTGEGWLGEHGLDMDVDARVWRAEGLAEFGATGLRGDARARGRLRVDWSGEDAEVDFSGQAAGGAFGVEEAVALGPWAGPVTLRYDGSGTRVEGALEAEQLSASGAELAWLSGPFLVEVDPAGAVDFGADVQSLGLAYAPATLDALEGRVEGRLEADGHLRVGVSAGVTGLVAEGQRADGGTVALLLDGDRLTLDVDLQRGGEPVLGLEGGGDLASGAWQLDVLDLGALSGVSWHAEGPVRFTLAESGVVDASLHLRSPAGALRLEGDLGLSGPLDAQVTVEDLSLSWLGGMLPEQLGGWAGSLDLEARLGGRAEAAAVDLSAAVLGLSVPGQVWGVNLRGQAWGEGEGLRLRVLVDDAEGQLLALQGQLPLRLSLAEPQLDPRAPLALEAIVQPSPFGRLQRALPALGELPEGELAGVVRARGALLDPTLELGLGLTTPIGERGEWVRLDLDVEAQGEVARVSGMAVQRGTPRLQVSGELATVLPTLLSSTFAEGPAPALEGVGDWIPQIAVDITPLSLPLQSLSAFADLPEDLQGNVRGGVRLSGRPEAPVVEGALLLTEGHLGPLDIGLGLVSVTPVEGGYGLSADLGFTDPRDPARRGGLALSGVVPFDSSLPEGLEAELAREGLALSVRGDGVPLEVLALFDRAITDTQGELRIRGEVQGSLAAPRPELEAVVDGGAFTYRDLAVAFADLDLRARIVGDQLTLDGLRVLTRPLTTSPLDLGVLGGAADRRADLACAVGGEGFDALRAQPLQPGELFLEGRSSLAGLGLAELDLRLCGLRAWVSATRDMSLQISPQLTLQGPWPDLVVRGDVRTDELKLTLRESDFFGSDSLALDPALTIVRSEHAMAQAQEALELPFYHPWDIGVSVDLNRQLFLNVTLPMLDAYDALGLSTVQIADAQVNGVLDVRMLGDALDATGELETLRGEVVVLGEEFELRSGTLTFSGQGITNPVLDILAVRDTGTYGDIAVRISQTAENPDLEFSADGPYTLTDIMSILMLGRPTSELSDANAGALGNIMGFVASQAAGALFQKAGSGGASGLVDSFSIEAVAAGLPSLTVGNAVGDQGFLEFTWNFNPDDDEPMAEVLLEWSFSRRLEGALYVGMGQTPTYSGDIYYTLRF